MARNKAERSVKSRDSKRITSLTQENKELKQRIEELNKLVSRYPDLFEEFLKKYEQFKIGAPQKEEDECVKLTDGKIEDIAAHEEIMIRLMDCFILGDPEKEKRFLAVVWEDIVGILQKRAGNSETEMADFMKTLFNCSTPEEFFNELFSK